MKRFFLDRGKGKGVLDGATKEPFPAISVKWREVKAPKVDEVNAPFLLPYTWVVLLPQIVIVRHWFEHYALWLLVLRKVKHHSESCLVLLVLANFRDESDGVMCQIEVEIIVCHRSITLMYFSSKMP